jgi:hypothetical protein
VLKGRESLEVIRWRRRRRFFFEKEVPVSTSAKGRDRFGETRMACLRLNLSGRDGIGRAENVKTVVSGSENVEKSIMNMKS